MHKENLLIIAYNLVTGSCLSPPGLVRGQALSVLSLQHGLNTHTGGEGGPHKPLTSEPDWSVMLPEFSLDVPA